MHGRQNVAVRVQGEHDVGVPESLAYDLRVLVLRKQEGRAGVVQIVEPQRLGQPGALEDRFEVSAPDVEVASRGNAKAEKERVYRELDELLLPRREAQPAGL